jgi:hypothetical protein
MTILKHLYDLAFNNLSKENVFEIKETLGLTMFIHDSKLHINLKPTRNTEGWKINFTFLKKEMNLFYKNIKPAYAKTKSKDRVHSGYINVWLKFRFTLFEVITVSEEYQKALQNGLFISGRSKGGGLASLIALDLVRNFKVDKNKVFVNQIEAPKIGNKHYNNSVHKYLNKENIFFCVYKRDIVPMALFYNKFAGNKVKLGNKSYLLFSFKDHKTGCFDEEEVYSLLYNVYN